MAYQLQRLLGGLRLGKEFWDYATAFGSGIVDGFLLGMDADIIFLIKNIGIPIAKIFIGAIPDGLAIHSTGQLGMIATMFITKSS